MGTKQFDSATDLITFTRASGGTFLGSDGLLQTAANNVPRIEYDATGAVKGLLIEEARTNLVVNSGNLTTWLNAGSGADIGSVTTGSPFGTYQTFSNSASPYQFDKTLTSGSTYVCWLLVKYSSGNGWFVINNYDTGGSKRAWFDVQNGVVGVKDSAIIDYGMVDYGDGWWLCWSSKASGSTSGGISFNVTNGDGLLTRDVVDTVLIAGTQMEAGAFPTSYIPTVSSTATRAADFAQIPTSAFGYNNDKGSLVIDVLTPDVDQFMALSYFQTTSYFNSRSLWKSNLSYNGAGDYFFFQTYDGTTTKFAFGQQTQAGYTKLGLSYGDSERAVKDGGTVASGTSRYPNPNRLYLGGRDNGFQSQCWIKSMKYYPRQLTDTQLQELTT